jgi:hypothetical protein
MRLRTLLLFGLAASLGAALAVLPALAAGPSVVTLEVNENCEVNDWPCWALQGSGSKPAPASRVTIASGGAVVFSDEMGHEANIKWTSTPSGPPTCSPTVPVSPTAPKTGWKGECKFTQPGTYSFESSTLFDDGVTNFTQYEIVVGGTGTGTTTTTTTTTPTTTSTTPTSTTTTPTTTTPTTTTAPTDATSTAPSGGADSTGAASTQSSTGAAESTATMSGSGLAPAPFGASHPLAVLALAHAQRGDAVHGTIQIPSVDGGARLEVELLAQDASLANAKRHGSSRVGRFVRNAAPAGKVSFTVALDAQAKRALGRNHKLALTVKSVLTPVHGAALTLTRSLELR